MQAIRIDKSVLSEPLNIYVSADGTKISANSFRQI